MSNYRPIFRQQKPSADPKEPWPGESAAQGNEHAWNNCVMTSGAMALDYHTLGAKRLWGGDLRHHQGDMDMGTDLGDLERAWAHVGAGYNLRVKSGEGWAALMGYRRAGCAVVCQGIGDTPGSGTYRGGHAAILLPNPNRPWGDPLASRWQDVSLADVRRWMERLNPRLQFAITRAR